MRQGLNLSAPETTVPERGTVLHALCRAAASCPEPKPGQMQLFCEMARLLLHYGVDPRQTNAHGEMPVQVLIPQQIPLTAQPPPADDASAAKRRLMDVEYIQGLRCLHRLLAC